MKQSFKIFLACAIGAGLGSLVALQIHQYFWWVGLLVGGLAGYLSYEWQAVARAVPKAWRSARNWQMPKWHLSKMSKQVIIWNYLLGLIISFYFFATIITLSYLAGDLQSIPLLLLIFIVFIPMASTIVYLLTTGKNDAIHDPKEEHLKETKESCYWLAPPLVIFWHLPRVIFWHLPRGIYLLGKWLKGNGIRVLRDFILFLRRFFWRLFLLIHSEIRLLCGLDAMLGAGIGYFAGSALIGALAGGVLGVINYALVTKRWLIPKGYLPVSS